jgi:hypothetical protein
MPAIKIDPTFFNHDAQAGGFFPLTHTNPGFDIDAFLSGTGKNLLVEGIRGTGKTHILKMISSRGISTYSTKKILPVYISVAKVSEWESRDIHIFRIHLYANIVNETISTLEREKAKIGYQKSGAIEKAINNIKKMFGIEIEGDIDLILKKIREINENLLSQLTYNQEKILERVKKEQEQNIKLGIAKESVQTSWSEILKILNEKEIIFVGKNFAYENASKFIVEFFKLLQNILGCRYIILLLDECSETSEDAQVEIFRLLKLIRGSFTSDMQTNYVYFCASVYPPYSTNYPSKSAGHSFNFEPGQDASVEYLQLDELADDFENFFLEMTKKRLDFICGHSISNPIKAIFENEGAFFLAAYSSNGIPRRYLEILKQGYDTLCQRSGGDGDSKKISQKDIEDGIQTVASNQILSLTKLTTDDFKIIEEISQRIGRRNKKTETENKEKEKPIPANVYFTINRSQFGEFKGLLLQGCVHDKGRTRLKKYYKEEGSQGPLFMLDLSLSIQYGAIDKRRAIDIFRKDLKENAKSGYLSCQDFDLKQFEYQKGRKNNKLV